MMCGNRSEVKSLKNSVSSSELGERVVKHSRRGFQRLSWIPADPVYWQTQGETPRLNAEQNKLDNKSMPVETRIVSDILAEV